MKKLISSVLAAVVLMGCVVTAPAYAAGTIEEQTYQNILSALGIMTGYDNGSFGLENTLTRAEFAKLAIKASSLRNSISENVYFSPFSDVGYTHWSAPFVSAAATAGYMKGYSDGSFKPSQTVKLEEAVVTVLRLQGYSESDFTGIYPGPELALAGSTGLLKSVAAKQGTALTRRDAMYLLYNLLESSTKNGQKYIAGFGFQSVDYGTIIGNSMTGPIVVKSLTWYAGLGLREAGVKVYKGGGLSSLSSISMYDVVYYSAGMNTVWVYNKRVTGLYEKATPDPSYPSAATIAGTSYTFETTSVAGTMSSFGSCKVGDTVTVLLGKNGGIVDVLPLADSEQTVYGVVTAAGEKAYQDDQGVPVAGKYAVVFLPDGGSATYRTASDYSSYKGQVVSVKFSSGKAILASVSGSSAAGMVSVAGNRIGSSVIAEGMKVVELVDGAPRTVNITRLDGVRLAEDNTLYSVTVNGAITTLFINNVTDDNLNYGYLFSFSERDQPSVSGTYTFDIAGKKSSITTNGTTYGLETAGPARMGLSADGKTLSSLKRLMRLSESVVSLDGKTLVTAAGKYLMAENTAYYIKVGADYQYATLSTVIASGYEIKAYYEKSQENGGRIRVILAG